MGPSDHLGSLPPESGLCMANKLWYLGVKYYVIAAGAHLEPEPPLSIPPELCVPATISRNQNRAIHSNQPGDVDPKPIGRVDKGAGVMFSHRSSSNKKATSCFPSQLTHHHTGAGRTRRWGHFSLLRLLLLLLFAVEVGIGSDRA